MVSQSVLHTNKVGLCKNISGETGASIIMAKKVMGSNQNVPHLVLPELALRLRKKEGKRYKKSLFHQARKELPSES